MTDQNKMPMDIGQIRVDIHECDGVKCPNCEKDEFDTDTYHLEIELKHISAIKAGREMHVPIAYLTCTFCGERLVMNDQLVIINLGKPGG